VDGAGPPPGQVPSSGSVAKRSAPTFVIPLASLPPPNATPVHLMTWIRENVPNRYDEEARVSRNELVNRIGYVCWFFLARTRRTLRSGSCVSSSAIHGDTIPTARVSWWISATDSRGTVYAPRRGGDDAGLRRFQGRAWVGFDGGDEHAGWLGRALAIDPVETRRTLAASVMALIPVAT